MRLKPRRTRAGHGARPAHHGAAEHIAQRVNLAVVAKTELPRLLAHAKQRGWRRLRLLSSAADTCNRDYHGKLLPVPRCR